MSAIVEVTNDKVRIRVGIGWMEYTPEQLQQQMYDFEFLLDAVLYILNPELAEKSDLNIPCESVMDELRDVYRNTNYSQKFIDKIFTNHRAAPVGINGHIINQ